MVVGLMEKMLTKNSQLEWRLQAALRQLYRKRSEKVSPEQLALFLSQLEDSEAAKANVETTPPAATENTAGASDEQGEAEAAPDTQAAFFGPATRGAYGRAQPRGHASARTAAGRSRRWASRCARSGIRARETGRHRGAPDQVRVQEVRGRRGHGQGDAQAALKVRGPARDCWPSCWWTSTRTRRHFIARPRSGGAWAPSFRLRRWVIGWQAASTCLNHCGNSPGATLWGACWSASTNAPAGAGPRPPRRHQEGPPLGVHRRLRPGYVLRVHADLGG